METAQRAGVSVTSDASRMGGRSIESGADDRLTHSAWIAGLLFVVNLMTGCAVLVRAPLDEPPAIDATQSAPMTLETKVPSVAAPRGPHEISKTQAVAATPEPVVLPIDAPRAPRQSTKSQGESAAVELPAPSVTMPSEPLPTARVHGVETAASPAVAPVAPAVTGSPAAVTAKAHASAAKTPVKVAAARASPEPPAATERPPKKETLAPSPAKPETSPPLDLKSLETRLKETKAIGVFTKLALKNQVDDLLDQFRAFYQGRLKSTLAELRQSYDRLLLKVLALLQDADRPLAQAIVASREAIWGILADPVKFTTL